MPAENFKNHQREELRPYEIGRPGRPPGQISQINRALRVIAAEGFEPLVEAIKRYRDPDTPNASKDYCLGLVIDRVYPKLKAVEHTNSADSMPVLINIIGADTIDAQQTIDDAQQMITDAKATQLPLADEVPVAEARSPVKDLS